MVSGRARQAVCALLALFLLLALAGCGGGAELKTGQKLIKEYLSGRGAEITECYVEMLRPDGTKPVASDFVKGSFRVGGADYNFAVNTVTGAVYTSERLAELNERIVARIAAQLGLDARDCLADCLVTLYAPPWQTPNAEWPWARSCLGSVLPVDLADMDACAAQLLADENARILLYLACRADELYEGRWTVADMAGWEAVEVHLFGFAADEPLPAAETFPRDYFDASDRPQMTLNETAIRYFPGT